MNVASMVLGILSLVFMWVPFLGIVLALAGLPLGIAGRKRNIANGTGKGMATTGVITCIISIIPSALFTIFVLALLATPFNWLADKL